MDGNLHTWLTRANFLLETLQKEIKKKKRKKRRRRRRKLHL
jgi:hypothetical protein